MRPEVFASFVEHLDRMARSPLEKQAQYGQDWHFRDERGPDGVIYSYRRPGPHPLRPAVEEKTTLEKVLPVLTATGMGLGMASGIPALARAGLGPGVWAMLRRGAMGAGIGWIPSVGYYGARGVQDVARDLRGDS